MGVFLYQSGQRVFWKPVWFSLGSGFIPSRIRTQINIIQKNKTCYFWHKMENCWIKSSHANMWSQTLDLSLHAQDWLPFACSMWIIVIPFEYVSIFAFPHTFPGCELVLFQYCFLWGEVVRTCEIFRRFFICKTATSHVPVCLHLWDEIIFIYTAVSCVVSEDLKDFWPPEDGPVLLKDVGHDTKAKIEDQYLKFCLLILSVANMYHVRYWGKGKSLSPFCKQQKPELSFWRVKPYCLAKDQYFAVETRLKL